jgi:hypothetical protein
VIVERIPFGRFTLVESRGAVFGCVMLAPEYILLQRASHTSVRDVSYLVVWSEERSRAIAHELMALATDSDGAVADSPEVLSILHAIAPASTPIFAGGGECRQTLRALTRRQLEAELRATATRTGAGVVAKQRAS